MVMADLPLEPPTRSDIRFTWERLIAGTASREETAHWARVRMVAHYDDKPEMLVMSAIQCLDGFDLSHGDQRSVVGRAFPLGNRIYYHSDEHIKAELQRWLNELEAFDADPAGFMDNIAKRRQQARHDPGTAHG